VATRPSIPVVNEGLGGAAGSPSPGRTLSDRVRALKLPDEDEMQSRGAGRWLLRSVLVLLVIGMGAASFYAYQRGWFAKQTATNVAASASKSTGQKPTTTAAADSSSSASRASQSPGPTTSSRNIPVASSGDVALEAKGYIIPAHQILVSPLVNGRILHLSLEEGRRVEKGEVLAEIETTEYEADVAHTKATVNVMKHRLEELEHGSRPEEVNAAKNELAEARAQRQQLLSDWKRKVQLREKGVLTENEYEQAEALYKAMDRRAARLENTYNLMVEGPRSERIEVARAELAQAEAGLKRAQWRLDNCTIRAPIAGTILKKNAEEGNIVNPIAFNGSFSLCEMADLSDLEVDLSIQERDISRVQKGQRCQVRAEAYPDRVYEGVVSRLMPIADRAKGAIPVRVKLTVPADEEGIYLKPEMGVVVSFLKNDEQL
jgi:HlyD family secretion protein